MNEGEEVSRPHFRFEDLGFWMPGEINGLLESYDKLSRMITNFSRARQEQA